MAFRMLLLAFSVLLIAEISWAKLDCEDFPFKVCSRPDALEIIPREISDFNDYCVSAKSHLRCLKNWQDQCGTDRVVFFQSPEIFEAVFNTVTEVCEDGTLLNTIATENLKCYNETFGKTHCHEDSDEFIAPYIREARENEDSDPKFSIFCLKATLVYDCVIRAASDNCGQLVGEATYEMIRRSKSVSNGCSGREAGSVLDELDNLDLNEDKKESIKNLLSELLREEKHD